MMNIKIINNNRKNIIDNKEYWINIIYIINDNQKLIIYIFNI